MLINRIGGGGEKPTQEKTVTPNASGFEVVPDEGFNISKVTVNGDSVPMNAPTSTMKHADTLTVNWNKRNL